MAVRVLAPAVVPKVQLPTVAMPLALVAAEALVSEPPPLATAKVTFTPDTGLLLASLTMTLGAVATAVPATAVCALPAFRAICLAAPALPVALKVTGEPLRPVLVAVRVLAPAVVPKVQLPTVAMPLALVVAEALVSEPPPLATAKVTFTPDTGLLLASLTMTLGAVATAVPATAVCALPAFRAICLAAPALPVALKVTGEPLRPVLVAVRVLAPAVVPKVQLPTVAMPLALVAAEALVSEPPPLATAKVTFTPDTGLLLASLTMTLGAVATAVPATAVCALPAFRAICVAIPTISNAKRLLQAPARRALLPRTFQVRLTYMGSALLLFHERFLRPVFLRSSLRPL